MRTQIAAISVGPPGCSARLGGLGATAVRKGHTKDGRGFCAVPSQSGDVLHMADTRAWTCRDFERRQQACKHVLAIRLHVARLKAQQPRRRPARQHARAARRRQPALRSAVPRRVAAGRRGSHG